MNSSCVSEEIDEKKAAAIEDANIEKLKCVRCSLVKRVGGTSPAGRNSQARLLSMVRLLVLSLLSQLRAGHSVDHADLPHWRYRVLCL